MTENEINKIKEKALTVGGILVLIDGTRIYCESIEQLKWMIKKRKFSDASYVEYGKDYERRNKD